MGIREALANCRRVADCPALIDALGGSPRFMPFSPAVLGAGSKAPRIEAAAEVGRLGPVPCVAIESSAPERDVIRLARGTMVRGEPSLFIGLGGAAGPIVFAIGSDPTSRVHIDPATPDGVTLAVLARLGRVQGEGRHGAALRIAGLLGGQRVDRRFFEAFRRIRDRFADEGPVGAPLEERRSLALLHLTRVLFLYFVQQKGWLDGRADFLSHAVDDHLGRRRDLDRDLFRPLFFGTLNRPEATRGTAVRRFGRIPFLNGGLFEPNPLERRWPVPR